MEGFLDAADELVLMVFDFFFSFFGSMVDFLDTWQVSAESL